MKFIVLVILFIGLISLASAGSLLQDTRHYYKFDENTSTTAADSTGSSNLIVANAWTAGKIRSGYIINDSSRGAVNTGFNLNYSQFSLNFWLNKTSDVSRLDGVLGNTHIPTSSGDFRLVGPAGLNSSGNETHQLALDFVSGAGRSIVVLPPTLNRGAYNMLTLTFNATAVTFYFNGVHSATYVTTGLTGNTNTLGLFSTATAGGDVGRNFTFDELGVFNRTLNITDVDRLYNSGAGNQYPFANSLVQVTLNSPINGAGTNNLTFNATIYPTNVNLTNATFYLWNSSSGLLNTSFKLVNGSVPNNTVFLPNTNLSVGNYLWNVYACGRNASLDTLCSFAPANFTFGWTPFSIVNQSFNYAVYETSRQRYSMVVNTLPNILSLSANLVYNSTSYVATASCSGTLCTINRTLDVPLIRAGTTQNNTFFWQVTVFDGSSFFVFNTTGDSQIQKVDKIFLQQCGGSVTDKVLNFTAYDEGNLTKLENWSFAGTFNYWLGGGTVRQNFSVSNNSLIEQVICISPGNETFYHTSQIDYGKSGYVSRNYYFQNATLINTSQQDVQLFLLNVSDSTSFILKVLGENLNGIPGALINIQRYYPQDNVYRTVQIAKTDDNGNSVGFYKTETVDYRHIIVLNGSVIISTNEGKIIGESVPFTLQFQVGQSTATPWSVFEGLSNLQANLSYNSTTEVVSFSYIDVSGTLVAARLVVEQERYSEGPQTLCDTTSLIASATIVCNVSAANGTITARAYVSRSPSATQQLVDLLVVLVNQARDVFGRLGLFGGVLIIMVAYLASLRNLTAGLIIGCVVTILVNMTPLIDLPALFIWADIALTVMAVVAINKR